MRAFPHICLESKGVRYKECFKGLSLNGERYEYKITDQITQPNKIISLQYNFKFFNFDVPDCWFSQYDSEETKVFNFVKEVIQNSANHSVDFINQRHHCYYWRTKDSFYEVVANFGFKHLTVVHPYSKLAEVDFESYYSDKANLELQKINHTNIQRVFPGFSTTDYFTNIKILTKHLNKKNNI